MRGSFTIAFPLQFPIRFLKLIGGDGGHLHALNFGTGARLVDGRLRSATQLRFFKETASRHGAFVQQGFWRNPPNARRRQQVPLKRSV